MGKNNKQRRAAKKRRQQSRRSGGGSAGARQGRRTAGSRHARDEFDVPDLVAIAVHAWENDPPTYDAAVERLADHAAAGEPVAKFLEQRVHDALDGLWPHGWAPNDVVRVAGRQLGSGHADVVRRAVVDDGRRRASQGSPPHARWQAQLDVLSREVRGALELPEATDVRVLVPTLALLLRLAPLPPVMPPPNAAEGIDVVAAARMDERMLARVRGLLAKAESTEFDEEAQALTAKAQELITRHAIDDALLHAGDDVGEPSVRRVGVDNPYPDAKAALLSVVAEANRCEAVHSPAMGWVTLIGFDGDLDAVELLGASLLAQATSAMAGQGSRRDRHGRSTTRSFRRAFLFGYATRIGERLQQAADAQVRAETDQERLLPVLAARDVRVTDTVAEVFPELERRPTSFSNTTGWINGVAAADLADLTAHRRPVGDSAR